MERRLNSLVRSTLIESAAKNPAVLDEDLAGVGRAVAKTFKDYGTAASNVASSAGQFAGRLAKATLDTVAGQAHAPGSYEDVRSAQASRETLVDMAGAIGTAIISDLFFLKYRVGAKIYVAASPDERAAYQYLESKVGEEKANELLAGSIIHDVLFGLSFVPQLTVAAMLLDSFTYALEDDKEAAITALAMAGVTHALFGSKISWSSEIPKDATRLLATEVHPVPIDELASVKSYDEIAQLVQREGDKVSLLYRVVCEACYRVKIDRPGAVGYEVVERAQQAVQEMGQNLERRGVPGAQGIAQEAAARVQRGEFSVAPIADQARMGNFDQAARGFMEGGQSGVLGRARYIVDQAKYEAQQGLSGGQKRNPLEREIAQQASVHGQTGTYMVPELPPPSAESASIASRSRQTLSNLDDAARARAETGIAALSQLGLTIEAAFKSTADRTAIIVRSRSGQAYAYYRSTGTGSGTPRGSWVPYEGNSMVTSSYETYTHVTKLADATGKKVPYMGQGEAREVFDGLNHPYVRDAIEEIPYTHNFGQPPPGNLNNLSIREFVKAVSQMANENGFLSQRGVRMTGGDLPAHHLVPWPEGMPVPPTLNNRVLRMDELLENVRFEVRGSSRFRDGVYNLGDVISSGMSFIDRTVAESGILNNHEIGPRLGGGPVVTGPYSSWSQKSNPVIRDPYGR